MKRIANSYQERDPEDRIDELLSILRSELTDDEIIDELRNYIDSESLCNALEYIAEQSGIYQLSECSEAYEKYQEWYSQLSDSDQNDVADIIVSIELDDIEHITDDDLGRIQDIFEFMHNSD